MFDELLQFILKRIEAAPGAAFLENELTPISKSSFERLKKEKFLKFVQYDPENEPYYPPGDDGDGRLVRKIDGKYLAFPAEGSPLTLTLEDLNRWSFDTNILLERIKKENDLARNVNQITPRVHFIGEKIVLEDSVSVFVAFLADDEQAETELICLRTKIERAGSFLILCPSFVVASVDLLNRLARQDIICLAFKDAFSENDYTIDFSKIQFGQAAPKLTAQQIADYDEYKYQCHDRFEIPGTSSLKRSNDLIMNGHKIKMPDRPFPLLIEMVVALKKNKGGWIKKNTQPGEYQIYGHLKSPIETSLEKKDANKFIQNDASKRYRISTHPDFITYNKEQLLCHSLPKVRELAKKLP